MGYTGDRCYVRCQLDDGELLCQLAEEAVELAQAAERYNELFFPAYCLGEEKGLEDKVIEEIADVELVLSIMMKQDETEELLETLKRAEFSESDLRNDRAVCDVIRLDCLVLAKAALKLRRAMYLTNPTPMTEAEARKALMDAVYGAVPVMRAWCEKIGASNKVADIKIRKAQRWANRLSGGMENEGVYENRPELLGE